MFLAAQIDKPKLEKIKTTAKISNKLNILKLNVHVSFQDKGEKSKMTAGRLS